MDGTFLFLKIARLSSILSGLTWIVTIRASIAPILLPVSHSAGLALLALLMEHFLALLPLPEPTAAAGV